MTVENEEKLTAVQKIGLDELFSITSNFTGKLQLSDEVVEFAKGEIVLPPDESVAKKPSRPLITFYKKERR